MSEGIITEDLRELARLLNLWREHHWVETDKEALASWVQESASRTRLPPRFHVAWDVAVQFGLIAQRHDELVSLANEIINCWTDEPCGLDQFHTVVALRILERMLDIDDYAASLEVTLSAISYSPVDLSFPWADVPVGIKKEAGWIWLQHLGFLTNDGTSVTVDASLMPYIVQTSPTRRAMTQKELNERLAAQNAMADLAEEHVVTIEKARLRMAGLDDLAEGVYRVSLEDVAAGFDVLSFDIGGHRRRIEVKASAGPRRSFFISKNEVAKAKEYKDSYWLAWLSFCERLPDGPIQVSWFQDPAKIMEETNGPWEIVADHFLVKRVNDDTPFMVNVK